MSFMGYWTDGGVPTVPTGFVDPSAICEEAQYNDGYDPPFAETAFSCLDRQNQEYFAGIIGSVLPYYQEESL